MKVAVVSKVRIHVWKGVRSAVLKYMCGKGCGQQC